MLPSIPAECIDAVITDPPYGIKWDTDYTKMTGGSNRKYAPVYGDDRPFDPTPWLTFAKHKRLILWGANCYSNRLPGGSWLVWDKRHKSGKAFLADGEVAWMNRGFGIHILSKPWQGCLRSEPTFHPTQKPTEVMMWCIERAGMPGTILDPYSGSGSTLAAAKKLSRHFLGFEISPEYCAVARDRLAAIEAQPALFAMSMEQMSL